ncbi:MAG TPA: Uma2 family endonuclease [Blastocatellia bacterium]|nr:Uma2 family endonuclease [Blastocatellia bacterium]HMX28053.1 Uma2 family endonuclease [Blastocatellia bacterium]HMY74350.1 Uma2 family endonuclease [Blastocatellia bacterium]HMZ17032.1 Uma2 family endonuclease [Blastocatellia bacterium]HNG33034.1 Uma2 family endonuclease [Blastocatellia bacterium]
MTRNAGSKLLPVFTEEEYLAFERISNVRHEYLAGQIYAMAGATREHNLITGNVAAELRTQLKGKPCETYSSDMRVRVPRSGQYTHPDVVVVCGKPQFLDGEADTLLNPVLIVEVLSPSTEAYDRGEKFRDYRSVESFSEYVLISQAKQSADHFTKINSIWTIQEVEREIKLVTIPCLLTFSEIYDRVEFGMQY